MSINKTPRSERGERDKRDDQGFRTLDEVDVVGHQQGHSVVRFLCRDTRWRRLPRWVTWCGMPGIVMRASRVIVSHGLGVTYDVPGIRIPGIPLCQEFRSAL